MPTETYLIVPAWSDQAGYCRIVSRNGCCLDALNSYRSAPDLWHESGRMNSRGEIVCLDNPILFKEMKEDQPLMAGMVYYSSSEVTV